MTHDAVLNVRLPREMIVELDVVAGRRRLTDPRKTHSRNSVVREALAEWLDRQAAPRARQRPAAK